MVFVYFQDFLIVLVLCDKGKFLVNLFRNIEIDLDGIMKCINLRCVGIGIKLCSELWFFVQCVIIDLKCYLKDRDKMRMN